MLYDIIGYLGLDVRKPVFGEKQRRTPAHGQTSAI